MKILVIKLSSIGDVVSTTPAVKVLKEHFPDSEITWLVERTSFDLIKDLEFVDRTLVFEREKYQKLITNPFKWMWIAKDFINLIKRIRNHHFDIVLDFQGLLRSVVFLWISKADYKSGFNRWIGLKCRKVVKGKELAYEKYLTFLQKCLNIDVSSELKNRRLYINIPESIRKDVDKKLQSLNIRANAVFIGVGARWKTKKLKPQFIAELSKLLVENGFQPVFTGSKSDEKDLKKVLKLLPPEVKNRTSSLVGKLSLLEFAEALNYATAFITPDSGPMHIATATNTKVIALFGPTDPERTGPVGNSTVLKSRLKCSPCLKRHCPIKKAKCMNFDPEEVLKHINTD